MNNPNQFDDGFFAQRAEGNLSTAPNSFLQSPVIKRAGDSWVKSSVGRASMIRKPMKNMSCPPVTLNSFAAFADTAGESDSDPGVDPIYTDYGPTMAQAGFTPGVTTGPTLAQAGITSPGAVSGNSILDSISGIIKGITPTASNVVTAAASGQSTAAQQQLLKQYLAGKLPGYVLNAQGQVVPASSASASSGMGNIGPVLLIGGLGLVVVMMMSGGGRRR